MTTAQCNQPRRWSSLQCVRDRERTKDHENSARHVTYKQNQQQYCMRHMPAAIVHGGGSVLLMMTTKFASRLTNKKHTIPKKCNQSPLPHNNIQLKTTTQNHKQKQPSQQTPCSIKQTYCRDAVLPNEKDGPKMKTAQCNRRRRWGCLQCVRDGQRTKDHENSARHATNK